MLTFAPMSDDETSLKVVIRDGLVHPTETIPLRNNGDGNRVMSNAIANAE
jgi:hypothetical protein